MLSRVILAPSGALVSLRAQTMEMCLVVRFVVGRRGSQVICLEVQ